MYRTVLRPRWLIGHVVVLVAVVVMVNLGFWQLRRLDDRREFNRDLESRSEAPPLSFADLRRGDPDDLSLHRVRLRGEYDPENELLVRFRSREGTPGFYVLTPLVVQGSEAALVNRGWVPQQIGEQWPHPPASPPPGEVTFDGVVRAPETGPARLSEGEAGQRTIGAIAVGEIDDLMRYRLAPVYVVATGQATEFPLPVPPEDLGEGPHLSYAMQWFAFAATALVVWSILVWRAVRGGV